MRWVIDDRTLNLPDQFLLVFGHHKNHMSPDLWRQLAGLLHEKSSGLEDRLFLKWVGVLLSAQTRYYEPIGFLWLAERLSERGMHQIILDIFVMMAKPQMRIKKELSHLLLDESADSSASAIVDTRFEHYYLKEIWELLEPHLNSSAVPVIYSLILNIRERSQILTMFGCDQNEWDPDSRSRNRIGINDEERFKRSLHVLIDALRDSCLFVLENKLYDWPSLVAQLMEPAVPLLRRIAVFLATTVGHWTPDQRIEWLLDNISIDSYNEREELVHFVESNFPGSKEETRCRVLCAIDDITRNSANNLNSMEYADRLRFQYLDLLRKAVPNYEPLETRWSELVEIHPEWTERQEANILAFLHPETVKQVAPWNEKSLVSGAESEWLPTIINFVADQYPQRQDGILLQVTRGAAINVVADTASNNPMWGLRLAASLLKARAFDSFAWEALFRSWNFEVLDQDQILEIIGIAQNLYIHEKYPTQAAKLLKGLIVRLENDENFDLSKVLNQADKLAQSIWLNAKDPSLAARCKSPVVSIFS